MLFLPDAWDLYEREGENVRPIHTVTVQVTTR